MFVETTWQWSREKSYVRDILAVIGGSILIALFAPISIQLPFTPIPIAVQPHVCLFLAVLLGPYKGALAVLTYLFQGIMGLPVFALGQSGFLHLLGPRGGYLIGYLFAAYVTGYLVERKFERTPGKIFLAMAIGNSVIYLCGVPHLALYLGMPSAITLGMLPFLVGDMVKLILAHQFMKFSGFFFSKS